ncbi:4-hydroxybenzoate octaprenyltransferase [Celerinatantimonas diazotrophica]|uniref:4-hydroxybenzoate octaprenyltransferase n=1 Tax=Celerinatantimonas diazotrophica TaxID=412034 RepID=A0A4V2PNE7_9GAMM|nr:4-hydroxybenzoate polyprenyltransferase [Celerinatantimonas diazotrophica]CAG9295474.1 4-hydroxybenzoate octaprenyltransferase [Celerinatantimonas diazotrophica]
MVSEQPRWLVYVQLMRLNKPIGSLLLLWPTLWALWLAADGFPNPGVLIVFVLGVVMMRSAGCVINDFADRKIDGFVKRTSSRPFPSGQIATWQALCLFGALVVASFLMVLTQNRLTIELSFIAVVLAAIYPFMKRYTNLPQMFLGLAYSWAIPMAYAAQSGHLPLEAWLLLVANFCWTVAYDTFYAMVDRDDDIKVGIKSTAVLFGRFDKLMIAVLQLTTLLLLAVVGELHGLSPVYFVGLLAAAGMFVYQQYLARFRERENCFRAFLNNNYAGMIIFVAVAMGCLISA